MHLAVRAIHILAGSLAIVFGFIALYAAKGGRLHRRSGMMFVYTMIVMGVVGALAAAIWGRQPASNIPTGLLTAYLAMTALTTVRPPSATTRALHVGLMSLAAALTCAFWSAGFIAAQSPHRELGGIGVPPFAIFGAIALLSGIGDLRMMRDGAVQPLRGAPRLTRHLWRMCVALLIAAFSFFLGQSQVIPKPIRILPVLLAPPLIVLIALGYWVWRVRVRKGPASRAGGDGPRGIFDSV
jgi:uncharacterized membrane protein